MENPLKPILAGLTAKLAKFEHLAKERSNLIAKVKSMLPHVEAAHVIAVTYEKDMLLIEADSAAWCARLRYCGDALQRGWSASGLTPFTKLRFCVGRSPNAGPPAATDCIQK